MSHSFSVFANSCLRVPVDPISKMPKSERKKNPVENFAVDSVSTVGSLSVSAADVPTGKVKDFFRSIPDYNEINHLPPEEFYTTLKILREKKKAMLEHALDHIDNGSDRATNVEEVSSNPITIKNAKSKLNQRLRRKYSAESSPMVTTITCEQTDMGNVPAALPTNPLRKTIEREPRKTFFFGSNGEIKETNKKIENNECRPKRHHSACSITWNDKLRSREEIDQKFEKFFEASNYAKTLGDDFQTQSMPSSPSRDRRFGSPLKRRKSHTVPEPFKMTER